MWQSVLRHLAFQRFSSLVIQHSLLVCCVFLAFRIRFSPSAAMPPYDHALLKAVVMALLFQFALHLRDIYHVRTDVPVRDYVARLAQGLALGSLFLAVLYYAVPEIRVGRGIFLIAIALIATVVLLWNVLLRMALRLRRPDGRVVVLGTGGLARSLVGEIIRRPELGMHVCGFLGGDPKLVGVSIVNPKVIGMYSELDDVVAAQDVNHVVVELQDRRGHLPIETLLELKTRGVVVEEATSVYERVTGKIAIENLKPSWMIFNSGFEVSRRMHIQKRILSIVVSLLLLILFAPVILLVMLAIKLDSKGPVFFSQERVGLKGRTFMLWKFRSMRLDAERDTGPTWSREGDPRVTRVGKFLRRTRLDELPQLWNVLRGDMSFVGPRPERPVFVEQLREVIPFYDLRHSVKPGLTGWAQIKYQYGNTVRDAVEKLQYDLYYIKNISGMLDSIIMFETIKTVLVRRGS